MVIRVQLDGAERRFTIEEFEAQVRGGALLPETPVFFAGRWQSANLWPGWDTLNESPEAQVRARWSSPEVVWFTALTLGLISQVHLCTLLVLKYGGGAMLQALPRDTTAILERGESWRLLSYALLHSGLAHISANAVGILVGGFGLEKLLGPRSTASVLVATVGVGGALSALTLREVPSVGISAGDFGLLGACAALGIRYAGLIPRAAQAAFGATAALYTLYLFVMSTGPQVDVWAHAGGLVSGLLLGALYRPDIPMWRERNRRIDAAVFATVVAALLAIAALGPQLVPMTAWDADGAQATRPAWWTPQVGRSGYSGFGNGDRSGTVALDTARYGEAASAAQVIDAQVASIRGIDPAATVEQTADRATIHYQSGEDHRVLELRVWTRGLYATVAAVDSVAGARLHASLVAAVIDGTVLDTPDDVAKRTEGLDSGFAKSRLDAALALAELGDVNAALPVVEALRSGQDALEADAAWIELLVTLRHPSARAELEGALARHAGKRRIRLAAIPAWSALGEATRAVAEAESLLAENPGDRPAARALEALQAAP